MARRTLIRAVAGVIIRVCPPEFKTNRITRRCAPRYRECGPGPFMPPHPARCRTSDRNRAATAGAGEPGRDQVAVFLRQSPGRGFAALTDRTVRRHRSGIAGCCSALRFVRDVCTTEILSVPSLRSVPVPDGNIRRAMQIAPPNGVTIRLRRGWPERLRTKEWDLGGNPG